MALVSLDRARETTIVVGTTASAILLGAVSGYQSLAGVGNGNTTYYCIADQTGENWEVGIGTYTLATTTLTRAATPLASSNAGASVVFPAGTKDVFITYPAEKGVWLDASGNAIGLGTPASFVGTNITGTASGLTAGNVTTNANLTGAVTSSGNATSLGSFTSLQLATALTDETGTGKAVFATSPTLVTPILGTPTSGTLTSCTGLPLTTGVTGTLPIANGGTGVATLSGIAFGNATSAFTAATAAQVRTVLGVTTLSGSNTGDQTITLTGGVTGSGTGSFAATVVTNANLTGAVTSSGNATSLGSFTSLQLATALTDETGTGTAVFATSPTLVTPILGTPTSGTLTSCTGLPLTTGVTGTLPIANGGTGVATLSGIAFGNATSAFTAATAAQVRTVLGVTTLSGSNTGDQTITLTGGVTGSGTGSFAATVVTNANLTGAVTSSGNATSLGSFTSLQLATALTDETGTGKAVFATSPTLTTPTINSAQVPTISGTAPLYMCRAWVNFNGTGVVAIRGSGNVSSITDNGLGGDYTLNFTTAMPDANYSAIANCNGVSGSPKIAPHMFGSGQGIASYTASSVRMKLEEGGATPADREVVTVAIFR